MSTREKSGSLLDYEEAVNYWILYKKPGQIQPYDEEGPYDDLYDAHLIYADSVASASTEDSVELVQRTYYSIRDDLSYDKLIKKSKGEGRSL